MIGAPQCIFCIIFFFLLQCVTLLKPFILRQTFITVVPKDLQLFAFHNVPPVAYITVFSSISSPDPPGGGHSSLIPLRLSQQPETVGQRQETRKHDCFD